MREILFRAKSNKNWVYGYLNKHRGDAIPDGYGNDINNNDYYINDWIATVNHSVMYKAEPKTIGQFTGFRDSQQNEIFEGDFIQDVQNNIYVVEYIEEQTKFVLYSQGEYKGFNKHIHECRIIGNIYDNPELMSDII